MATTSDGEEVSIEEIMYGGKWLIVSTDNFGMSGETPGKDERQLLWPLAEKYARLIVETLNNECSNDGNFTNGPTFYKIEAWPYKLQVFEP